MPRNSPKSSLMRRAAVAWRGTGASPVRYSGLVFQSSTEFVREFEFVLPKRGAEHWLLSGGRLASVESTKETVGCVGAHNLQRPVSCKYRPDTGSTGSDRQASACLPLAWIVAKYNPDTMKVLDRRTRSRQVTSWAATRAAPTNSRLESKTRRGVPAGLQAQSFRIRFYTEVSFPGQLTQSCI